MGRSGETFGKIRGWKLIYHTIKGLQLDDFVGEKGLACAKHFITGLIQEMDLIFVNGYI